MFFVDVLEVKGLGNRSYLAGGDGCAVAVDPPRDVDRVVAAAARRGVRIAYVAETHLHNDYVTGGLELARLTGARYLVPERASVSFARTPVRDGDTFGVCPGLALRAVATPGHTPHHTAYVLEEDGRGAAVFTGGSLLMGTVGRPDLVEPRLTEQLTRDQHASARRLAGALHDEVEVLPTHGFGSFCSSVPADGESSTVGTERRRNDALVKDVETFVAETLAGLDDVPAYYAHMGPVNAAGPAPVDLTPPREAGADEIRRRLADGEWIVDLRNRAAFAEGHVPGTYNFECDGKIATYLAWLIPWGKPVTLLGESAGQVAEAQRELVRVGIDRPAAAAGGGPYDWLREGEKPGSYERGSFADLAAVRAGAGAGAGAAAGPGAGPDDPAVVLDVRRGTERAKGFVEGSVHIPIHELHGRTGEVPPGVVWVHCATGMRAAIGASLLAAAGRTVVMVDDHLDAAPGAGLSMTRPRPEGRGG
ncbi:Glyoxylase, beta-lactamase superfamily II [Streptomyces sp. WMMB 714]|uniref:MBL fold metallo-hydrolase n=1 Tax=Streptomyces sp. WMMB 714 TaxID=1286822 RepID=UPI0005F7A312|nr:MBL fold metallo-hydrolase [Streptomyces sp. WMMB 714]SCK46916.1 Glyoxylase, beta-lactamase superfamily II [Streptomyces sp. WMMB 714]